MIGGRNREHSYEGLRIVAVGGDNRFNFARGIEMMSAMRNHHSCSLACVVLAILTSPMIAGCLRAAQNHPIAFCGRVVDQHGEPVPRGIITGHVTAIDFVYAPTILANNMSTRPVTAITDANGNFTISGGFGISLELSDLRAHGYAFFEDGDYRYYHIDGREDFRPDANHPVVLRAWKLHGYEPLIERRQRLPFGAWFTLDLEKGTNHRGADANGDLQIKLVLEKPSGGTERWKLIAQAVDGGVAPAPARWPFEAPLGGYENSLVVEATYDEKGNEKGGDALQTQYYLKSRGGRMYSRLCISVVNARDQFVQVTSLANPKGSRVLEPEVVPPLPPIPPNPEMLQPH